VSASLLEARWLFHKDRLVIVQDPVQISSMEVKGINQPVISSSDRKDGVDGGKTSDRGEGFEVVKSIDL
jgi:hypothetical protein